MTRHFDRITMQIVAAVEQGAGEYRMPWHASGSALDQPVNATTGKAYRGLNVLGLWLSATGNEFTSGRWASYRQWKAAGAQVRKGAKGTPIFFWRARDTSPEKECDGDERKRGFVAKSFVVFNEDQVDGAPEFAAARSCDLMQSSDAATELFSALPAKVLHGGDRAYFEPTTDLIRLPSPEQFEDAAAYVSVRAHETIHWTGVKARLNRDLSGRFGTCAYAFEELVAELGSAFLCSKLGVCPAPRQDHAAYIASWLKVLRGDNKAILTAAAKAQQAVDFLEELQASTLSRSAAGGCDAAGAAFSIYTCPNNIGGADAKPIARPAATHHSARVLRSIRGGSHQGVRTFERQAGGGEEGWQQHANRT